MNKKNENRRIIFAWIGYLVTAIPIFIKIFTSDNIILSLLFMLIEILVCIPHIIMSIRASMAKKVSITETVFVMLAIVIHCATELFSILLGVKNLSIFMLLTVYVYQIIIIAFLILYLSLSIICIRDVKSVTNVKADNKNYYDELENIIAKK